MIDFYKIVDYVDGITVITDDHEAMEELEELFTELVSSSDEDRVIVLKMLEGWAYQHPKEMEQIKRQVEWRVVKNA